MTFEIGSTAYIVESNRIIREVTIVKRNGDFLYNPVWHKRRHPSEKQQAFCKL